MPGGLPVCLTVDQGVSRQAATDVRNLIAITVMITSYIGRNPLQMTNHHPMTNRQRTVPLIVARPKKHIVISTTIVTVILIHLIAIIQEKIHMEHLVPPKLSTYDSYDEGYDDIYMDGDYDDDRYDNDSDYADGVDDAMDDDDEDW